MIKVYKLYYKKYIYIGATTKALTKRLQQHRYYSHYISESKSSIRRYNSKLYTTIRELGKDNFKIELLAEAQSVEHAKELESYYINKEGSLNSASVSTFNGGKPASDKNEVSLLKLEIKELKKEITFLKNLSSN